jgi:hypothetical protein
MKLALVFTMFRKDEAGMPKAYKDWLYSKAIQEQLSKLGVTELVLRFASPKDVIDGEGYTVQYKIICPKATAVRLQLASLVDKKCDYVIFSDGDGQIPMLAIIEALNILSGTTHEAVISCRPRTKGIPRLREQIERFELFILEEIFRIHLPDGQCGFWGITGDILSRINITSRGFELEIDFLSEILKNSFNFCFIEVDVNRSAVSSFREEDHRLKLVFILDKFQLDGWDVSKFIAKYERMENVELPKEYKYMIGKLEHRISKRKKVVCYGKKCGACEKIEKLEKKI